MSCKLTCLLSGGKDSATTASVLAERGELERCLLIDTGIATPDHQPFVRSLCEEMGWPLEIIKTPASYDSLVRRFGFPGPAQHGMFMNYLKGRAIREFRKRYPGDSLASGVGSVPLATDR